jgi:hypothetical protein
MLDKMYESMEEMRIHHRRLVMFLCSGTAKGTKAEELVENIGLLVHATEYTKAQIIGTLMHWYFKVCYDNYDYERYGKKASSYVLSCLSNKVNELVINKGELPTH